MCDSGYPDSCHIYLSMYRDIVSFFLLGEKLTPFSKPRVICEA